MKHLLNTLFITTQNSYLRKDGEAIVVEVDREVKFRIPVHTLGGIVCFGVVLLSPAVMHLCMEKQVAVSFLSENGHFLGKVIGKVNGNVLLRREQYRRAEDLQASARIAKSMILGKIANTRTVLMRSIRDNQGGPGITFLVQASKSLYHTLRYLREEIPIDTVRGKEGFAANTYFEVFDHLIISQKDDFFFRGRTRRPPLDNVNALLSFIYTLLTHDVVAALEVVGLDPCVGFLHRDRPGRPSCALDLMEELRPYLADRLVLSLINRQQVKPNGFTTTESGGVLMDDKTRKTVLTAYQERKREEITHPFLQEKIQIGLLPYVQSMLFARYLRGDLSGYPPFIWR